MYYGGFMGIFSDAIDNLKKIVTADDEGFINDDREYFEEAEEKSKFPKFSSPFHKQSKAPMEFSSLDYSQAKKQNAERRENRGHIQVYVPRSFDEAFDIIKNIENGSTAMVNVETANQQVATRIVDVISGAMFALNGQCKKIGEKQYIFTLNAELSGAIDFLPGQSNPYNKSYERFDMQNPFSFGSPMSNPMPGPMPNPMQGMQGSSMGTPMYGQTPNYGQQENRYANQNYDYIRPQNQF